MVKLMFFSCLFQIVSTFKLTGLIGDYFQVLLEYVGVAQHLSLDVELLILDFVQSQELFHGKLDFAIDDVGEAGVNQLQVPVLGQLFEDLREALVQLGHLLQVHQKLVQLFVVGILLCH